MSKKKSELELAQEEALAAIQLVNQRIQVLGEHSDMLDRALVKIQDLFGKIRGVPVEQEYTLKELRDIRNSWKNAVDKIEKDYAKVCDKTLSGGAGGAVGGAAGAMAGVGVATLGPTAAMGVATTFGVASTGTAISTLSGAAASNAALAWLGGGALAAGGGGAAAGEAILAAAGPIGLAIAGASIVISGIVYFINKSKSDRLKEIFTLISKRDTKQFQLALVELNERIKRIKDETPALWEACGKIETFGVNYADMTEDQHYALGTYVNLMKSTTQLLVNPIQGLQPKYSMLDLDRFKTGHRIVYTADDYLKYYGEEKCFWDSGALVKNHPDILVSFANLLYVIELDDRDLALLEKSFKKNDDFLKSMKVEDASSLESILSIVSRLLKYKKSLE